MKKKTFDCLYSDILLIFQLYCDKLNNILFRYFYGIKSCVVNKIYDELSDTRKKMSHHTTSLISLATRREKKREIKTSHYH
jgi:hypothetical protein